MYSFVFLFDLIDLDSDLLRLFASQDLVSFIVEAIIFFFSIISWAIIFSKLKKIRKAESEGHRFMAFFARYDDIFELRKMAKKLKNSPLSAMFLGGCERLNLAFTSEANTGLNELADPEKDISITSIERYLNSIIEDEISNMERHLFFLATTANISTLLGLFGTVWGVMNVFMEIGREGSVNIAVVGPGVAGALITTIAGLIAAIPAAVAFNYFTNRIDRMGVQMNLFATEFFRYVGDKFEKEGRKVKV